MPFRSFIIGGHFCGKRIQRIPYFKLIRPNRVTGAEFFFVPFFGLKQEEVSNYYDINYNFFLKISANIILQEIISLQTCSLI